MVDTRGLSCPIPVVMVQQAIKKDAPATLEVLADAKVAVENITRLANTNGYQVSVMEDGLDVKLTLTKYHTASQAGSFQRHLPAWLSVCCFLLGICGCWRDPFRL